MARSARRAGEASPGDASQLGVKGRKTGVTLRDTGERDHLKMAPLNNLFSSEDDDPTPRVVSRSAAPAAAAPQRQPTPEATPERGGNDIGSDDMDIASSAGPGPGTVLRNRTSITLPKSRSPVKAAARLLSSPAKRHPNLSPARMSKPPAAPSPARQLFDKLRMSDGPRRQISFGQIPDHDDDNDDNVIIAGDFGADLDDMVNTAHDLVNNQIATDPIDPSLVNANGLAPGDSPPVPLSAKAKGKQRALPPARSPSQPSQPHSQLQIPGRHPDSESGLYVQDEPEPMLSPRVPTPASSSPPPSPLREPSISRSSPYPVARKRPSPAGTTTAVSRRPRRDGDKEGRGDASKRQRQTESAVPRPSEPPVKRGRGRPPKNGAVKRGRGRPRQSEMESDGEEGESLMTLQRGPPMPKSRGLVSMRRDMASGTADYGSRGRSYNDADWWDSIDGGRSSAYETDRLRGQRFSARAGVGKSGGGGRGQEGRGIGAEQAGEQALEDWEVEAGSVTGEIVLWEREYEEKPPGPEDAVQVTDERIALAASAIQTYAIRGSEARYAKPLTMPFLGAGLVDLPPGSEKRPKNSRKMHLVFFVHCGKVTVSVNDVQFRLSAGGMWFVPRGNYYNIANDDDQVPARVYFAQGCEVAAGSAMEEMTRQMDDADTREFVME